MINDIVARKSQQFGPGCGSLSTFLIPSYLANKKQLFASMNSEFSTYKNIT